MEILIKINCDDDLQDVKTHLSVIREQIIKAVKKSIDKFDLDPVNLSDNNCYGSHDIDIKFED